MADNNANSTSGGAGVKASMSRTSKMTTLQDAQSDGDEMEIHRPLQHHPSLATQSAQQAQPLRDDDQGVGRGTLLYTEKLGSAATATGTDSSSDGPGGEERRLIAGLPGYAQVGGPSAYGAVVGSPLPPGAYNMHSQQPQDPDVHADHHQHEFHYNNPDYPQDHHLHDPYAGPFKQQHSSSFCNFLVCCILKPLHMLCCCCSMAPVEEQQLHRSFCYGAIDGMLTGSGIVAAFCGMGLLSPGSTLELRLFVVAFSAAACFADSLCMALGHVWTTHVLVSASAKERILQRQSMETNKADAKGKLVDMLLARGMLKIDAMSLADTLEGYPDLFVSALVGDALIAGGVSGNAGHGDSSSDLSGLLARHRTGSGSGANRWAHWNSDEFPRHPTELDVDGGGGGLFSWKFPSYGERMNEIEHEDNPEGALVNAAMAESRREGFFMLLGFSTFAVVPSLIYLALPSIIPIHSQQGRSLASAKSSGHAPVHSGGSVSETTLVLISMACVMWCLGVWKSRFLDSNWALFGIETVVVLLVCVAAAYGLGSLLIAIFPGINASTLFVVSHDTIESL